MSSKICYFFYKRLFGCGKNFFFYLIFKFCPNGGACEMPLSTTEGQRKLEKSGTNDNKNKFKSGCQWKHINSQSLVLVIRLESQLFKLRPSRQVTSTSIYYMIGAKLNWILLLFLLSPSVQSSNSMSHSESVTNLRSVNVTVTREPYKMT